MKEIGFARPVPRVLKTVENNKDYFATQELVVNYLIDQNMSILDCYLRRIKKFNFVFTFNKERLKNSYKVLKFSDLRASMLRLKEARDQSGRVFFKDKTQVGMFLIDCESFKSILDSQIHDVISGIIDILIDKIAKENQKLSKEVDSIHEELGKSVSTLQELEALRNYAKGIEQVLAEVMNKITDIMNKLDLVEEMQHRISYEQFSESWSALGLPDKVRERARRTLIALEKREKDLAIQLRDQQHELDYEIAKVYTSFDQLSKVNSLDETDYASREFTTLG